MLAIGFDSGGSRTTFAVDSGSGPSRPAKSETAASIGSARADDTLDAAIQWIKGVILEREDEQICVWIGAAGFSAPTAASISRHFAGAVTEIASQMEDRGSNCEIFIANDAVSILKSPPLLGSGIAAVVGTGSVVIGAHPAYPMGVVQRGGYEWTVSDEGAGVWITLQSIRLLLQDIQNHGSLDYHSPLLDRLADHFGVTDAEVESIPSSHRAFARAELVARRSAQTRSDLKRFLASFVHPNIFDLAEPGRGRPHDAIASEVLKASVDHITANVHVVSKLLAAHTSDDPAQRARLPLVVGGNIAANPFYSDMLDAEIKAGCPYVSGVTTIGDASERFASLAFHYLESEEARGLIRRAFDPLHPVVKLM